SRSLAHCDRLRRLGGLGLEVNRADFVVVPLEKLLLIGVPTRSSIVNAVFARKVEVAGIALARFQRTDKRAGHLFFAQRLGFFLAYATIDQNIDVAPEAGGFRPGW